MLIARSADMRRIALSFHAAPKWPTVVFAIGEASGIRYTPAGPTFAGGLQ